jgi:hypothetical protein
MLVSYKWKCGKAFLQDDYLQGHEGLVVFPITLSQRKINLGVNLSDFFILLLFVTKNVKNIMVIHHFIC